MTFDFGDRRAIKTRRGTKEVGTYHLWVYLARWKLCVGSASASWDSCYDDVDQVLRQFEGGPIVAIEPTPTAIRFGGPGTPEIAVVPEDNADQGDALIRLYLPGHRVLSCLPSGVITLEDDRTP